MNSLHPAAVIVTTITAAPIPRTRRKAGRPGPSHRSCPARRHRHRCPLGRAGTRQEAGPAVIVDNKPGAAGTIGAEVASRAKPDGYTMRTTGRRHQPALYKKLPYDAEKAFTPISLVAELPLVLLVNKSSRRRTPRESPRSEAGDLAHSAGNGSSTHLAASLFENATDTKLMHVPYKGGGPAMQDLMAGQVSLTFLTVLESGPAIKSGKVKPIAVTSAKRSPAMPNLPTIAESGIPNYASISWIGLLAPAGTPKPIVDRISKDVQEIVNSAEMKERLIGQGATPVGSTAEQFKTLIDSDGTVPEDHGKNISATE
jgi:tripartite-type tricarboxylate transporter receptor subunit TctC